MFKRSFFLMAAVGLVLASRAFAADGDFLEEAHRISEGCHTPVPASLIEEAKAAVIAQANEKCGGTARQVSEFEIDTSCSRSWDDLANGIPAHDSALASANFNCRK